MHALIGGGGHDPEFLTDAQLAASPLRMPVADYLDFYATLPQPLRESIEEKWGPPPGDAYVDDGDFVVAGLELGDVLIAIQPPRGYGDDPVGIYHDPELPPTHHYLACYWWLDRVWGTDAIVHLGKHGTLEWLPGKTLALSAECAPDAALGDLPLVYPFVVNDPGEGVQAKRRAHATIVDHLVPPMMRADTYDEMAELEALLDEYARLDVLDPSKLPSLAVQIWDAIERANLQSDLGVSERPDDLGSLVQHIDGYSARARTSRSRTACTSSGSRRGATRCAGSCPRSCGSARVMSSVCAPPSARPTASMSPRSWPRPAHRRPWPRPACSRASAGRRPAPAISSTGSRPLRWPCSMRWPRASGIRAQWRSSATRCSAI